ncbi:MULTISPECIES: ATP-binding protein [unclassified Rhizobacter]|uniref:ATP-binding protein n=1 Tax=unclassified Rhizobacter TaxID=2640088 RepID=UPI0006F623CD|nr:MULTISPECIES: AAA family ATPase [unclassified Rhizobacter]KQU77057.1 hypothetical protein ASC88_23350 [Rhizobacter sp. Root29]KQW14221.1 hypothetical protein ASC98_16390 [Rhizobacter sp. Root1238]KRB18587.1 hypothetical protein ASE08_04930 [Rhizobacter sp. Root16D2]
MNAPERLLPALAALTLAEQALAQLAPVELDDTAAPEAQWLASLRTREAPPPDAAPASADRALHRLAQALALLPVECSAVALALAADTDPMVSRALAWLQAPLREMHPTAGLVAALHLDENGSATQALAQLVDGMAVRSGLLQLDTAGRTLPDAPLRVPAPVVLAASGAQGHWPGVTLAEAADALPPSLQRQAEQCARSLAAQGVLVVRGSHPREARSAAAAIARALGRRAAFIDGIAPPAGLAAWLALHQAQPVFCSEVAPGERQRVPALPGHRGPLLVASGVDGAWSCDGDTPPAWRVPLPQADERAALWRLGHVDVELAWQLATQHRHSAARIAQLCEAAGQARLREGDGPLQPAHLHGALRHARSELGSLAEALPDDVPDAALVLPPALRDELARVLQRCRLRDSLSDGLGAASRTRYRPGVRVLMVGPSGTGKTLSAGWLATQLSLPLYRVDLAAVTSKWIGETEKNLAELFARAEHAEAMLLFDEADALFGKRTEVKDANDRFANQQTNYLLQRIESCDGIVLLTSNSRSRFDTAFTRRLDAIVDFPAPGADERRALWLAHLGEAHRLAGPALNRLAAGCELAGGHIRNVALAARAASGGGCIDAQALLSALSAEYRKLGRAMPAGLLVVPDAAPG